MSRQYVNPAGLRRDGRRPHEIRRLRCRFNPVGSCDGSAYLEHGCNKIIAVVRGPRALASRAQGQFDRATVKCTYTQAPFAKTEHRKIRSRDRRTEQIAASIQKTFESVIQTHLYPRSEISIEIQVLQSDGGAVSSAINATTLALFDAGIPCTDYVVSFTIIKYVRYQDNRKRTTFSVSNEGSTCCSSFFLFFLTSTNCV